MIEKKQASFLFGNEKDDSFKSSLNTIVQTFEGKNVYSSIEEQAANLLYLVIKNHPLLMETNALEHSFLFGF